MGLKELQGEARYTAIVKKYDDKLAETIKKIDAAAAELAKVRKAYSVQAPAGAISEHALRYEKYRQQGVKRCSEWDAYFKRIQRDLDEVKDLTKKLRGR